MAVLGRLQWIYAQVALGRRCKIAHSSYAGKEIIHFTLFPMDGNYFVGSVCLAILQAVSASLHLVSSIDRGHTHSDGSCRITVVMKHLQSQPTSDSVLDGPSSSLDDSLAGRGDPKLAGQRFTIVVFGGGPIADY